MAAKIYANPQVNLTLKEFALQRGAGPTAASVATAATNYKLQPGDVIRVGMAEVAAGWNDYRINGDGTIGLANLSGQPLKVAGLTTDEATNLIRQGYVDAKVYAQPVVTVEATELSTRKVTILGQVAKPGRINLTGPKDMTLVGAIQAAGGPTPKADTKVTITRILPDGKTQVLKNVDLKGAMQDASKDIPLQDGDTVVLGEAILTGPWQP